MPNNAEVTRWLTAKTDRNVDDFVTYDDTRISWSRDLKADLKRGRKIATAVRGKMHDVGVSG